MTLWRSLHDLVEVLVRRYCRDPEESLLRLTWKVDAFALFAAYSLGNHFGEVGACCVQLGDCMFLFFP